MHSTWLSDSNDQYHVPSVARGRSFNEPGIYASPSTSQLHEIPAPRTPVIREPTTEVITATEHTLLTQQRNSPALPQAVVMSWTGGAPSAPDNLGANAAVSAALVPDELPPRCISDCT